MLTKRDREIVRWIGRHGAVQAQHVMTRFSIGRTAAYRRLHELVEFGLIRRHRLLYNDGGLLTATADGLRWADLRPADASAGQPRPAPAHNRLGRVSLHCSSLS